MRITLEELELFDKFFELMKKIKEIVENIPLYIEIAK